MKISGSKLAASGVAHADFPYQVFPERLDLRACELRYLTALLFFGRFFVFVELLAVLFPVIEWSEVSLQFDHFSQIFVDQRHLFFI